MTALFHMGDQGGNNSSLNGFGAGICCVGDEQKVDCCELPVREGGKALFQVTVQFCTACASVCCQQYWPGLVGGMAR